MITLSADLLLWLNAVTEDTIHMSIELEKEKQESQSNTSLFEVHVNPETADISTISNMTCDCTAYVTCLIFRKGYEFLYPFNMEYYLMASCMLYVMWKNVSRRIVPCSIPLTDQKLSLQIIQKAGLIFGPLFGAVVLITGLVIFILYQYWLTQPDHRFMAFLMFYGYHLAVMPVMCLCCLAGMLIHKLESRAKHAGHSPTRRLDVILLVGATLGQLALSYFSLVSALALGSSGTLGSLDLSYSILTLLQLLLQNIFIIHGLHRHPNLSRAKRKEKQKGVKMEASDRSLEDINKVIGANMSLPETSSTSAPPDDQAENCNNAWYKRATQEICAFLILSNVMLWVIPAFGANPQFENGLGKEFFGFTPWFILVNLCQPLGVFYRMHSIGTLMELLISA
ncbi:proton channel OTOP3-like [Aplochiton taeniatus]